MVKYENEFGEVKRRKRTNVAISPSVLKDLEALRLYTDEPIESVVKRLLQSMEPEEMTSAIFEKLRDVNAKMRAGWNKDLRARYKRVHEKRLSDKEWVKKLYDQAMKEADSLTL